MVSPSAQYAIKSPMITQNYETPVLEVWSVRLEANVLSGENGSSEGVGYDDDDPLGGN